MRVKLKCGSYYEGVLTKYFEKSLRYFYKLLFSGNMGNFTQVRFQGSIQGIWYHNLRSHSDGTRMINDRQRKRKEEREGGKEDNNSKQALKFRNENSFRLIHLDFRPQGKAFPQQFTLNKAGQIINRTAVVGSYLQQGFRVDGIRGDPEAAGFEAERHAVAARLSILFLQHCFSNLKTLLRMEMKLNASVKQFAVTRL